jgi:hypothetical protein
MLQSYVTDGMRLWREMERSTEAPKPHAIEDHLVDQVFNLMESETLENILLSNHIRQG